MFNDSILLFQAAPTINPMMNINSAPGAVMSSASNPVDKETLLMHEKLIQKQKELIELQQKKLELEVLQTKVKLQGQMKSTLPGMKHNVTGGRAQVSLVIFFVIINFYVSLYRISYT